MAEVGVASRIEDGPAAGSQVRHAYVHVPFCPTICPFCSFDVVERRAGAVAAYLERLDVELAETVDRLEVQALESIYLGGGTPSYLRDAEMARLLDLLAGRLGPAGEVTLEVHPATVGPGSLRRWVDQGITRLSLGVQSFDDAVLARLGRQHSADTNRRIVAEALATGATVSLDFITAIEGQDVAQDLRAAAATGVHHVSAYTLTIEDGTPFARDGVEPVEEREALDAASAVLGESGFTRYEVSNHSRPGARCAHNLGYWNNDWWVGVGPGASSHEPAGGADTGAVAIRRTNPSLGAWLEGGDPVDHRRLDAEDWAIDAVLMGLRMVEGVDLAAVGRRAGVDAATLVGTELEELVAGGRLVREGDRVRATAVGLVHLDAVMRALV